MERSELIRELRRHGEEAREEARRTTDPIIKARLHEIANELERLAEEMDALSNETNGTR